MKDEVDFLHADKRQRFLQSDAIILDVTTHMPKLPKFANFLQHLKKEECDEVDFCMQISMKACHKMML